MSLKHTYTNSECYAYHWISEEFVMMRFVCDTRLFWQQATLYKFHIPHLTHLKFLINNVQPWSKFHWRVSSKHKTLSIFDNRVSFNCWDDSCHQSALFCIVCQLGNICLVAEWAFNSLSSRCLASQQLKQEWWCSGLYLEIVSLN